MKNQKILKKYPEINNISGLNSRASMSLIKVSKDTIDNVLFTEELVIATLPEISLVIDYTIDGIVVIQYTYSSRVNESLNHSWIKLLEYA